jgi:hypothetical protein
MKITLDLSKLVEDGKLTPAEAARLKGLAAPGTSALGISILIGFGVISIAASAVALVPVPATAIAIGAAVFAAGLAIAFMAAAQWHLLAQICLVIGALMFSGGVIAFGAGSLASLLIVTAALAVGSIVARSSLLMVGAVLALAACLGARTGYMHASYSLAIYEPTVTIVLFGALALIAYHASKRLTADYESIAIAAARTSVLLVNFGFWIGSLWGDPLRLLRSMASGDPAVLNESLARGAVIPAYVFSVLWAVALLIVGVWGAKANRRWVVNVAAVFGAIHFYTQWFERLGANALSVLLGGLLMLAFGLALWTFNRRAETKKAS